MSYENLPRDFKGIWICKDLWTDKRLSLFEKCLISEIDSLDCGERHCFAENIHFGRLFDSSERTVSQAITKLKNLGFVEEIGFDGRRRTLKSNLKTIYAIFYGSDQKPASTLTRGELLPSSREDLGEREIPIEIPIENKKNKQKKEAAPPSADAAVLTDLLFQSIKSRAKRSLNPNLSAWASQMHKLIDEVKGDIQSIKDVITWLGEADWYKSNVQSPTAFIKYFDKMHSSMLENSEKDLARKNLDWAKKLKEKYPDSLKGMSFDKKFVSNPSAAKEVALNMNPLAFKQALCAIFGGTYDPQQDI